MQSENALSREGKEASSVEGFFLCSLFPLLSKASQEQSACRGAWKTPETQEAQPWAATAWPFQPGTVKAGLARASGQEPT